MAIFSKGKTKQKASKRKATSVKKSDEKVLEPYIDEVEKLRQAKSDKKAKLKAASKSSSDEDDSDDSDSTLSDSSLESGSSEDSDSSYQRELKKLQAKKERKIQEKEEETILAIQAQEMKQWKNKELFIDQELYAKHKALRREINDMGGATNWVKELFNAVNSGVKMTENMAWKMVSRFAVVMFIKEINKDVAKASEIIENIRRKHNVDEDEILEVILDDSRAAKVTYLDLQRLTNKRPLPQIFVHETFIGGLEQLKEFNARGLLIRHILMSQGIVDRKCAQCVNMSDHKRSIVASRSYDV